MYAIVVLPEADQPTSDGALARTVTKSCSGALARTHRRVSLARPTAVPDVVTPRAAGPRRSTRPDSIFQIWPSRDLKYVLKVGSGGPVPVAAPMSGNFQYY